ncbi:GNAT family N-acetyltransferase [Mariluticola halotolerans]|uniref:GNAT family N-acetyltransferase n=1 Tax=Mariluticola halotolerans TaxID=2909283 RepID=UPI0026E4161F|nr:GNAT family N-acetyltransferase [Mariluticola halotolerans]UJQ96143.1 GNAT family N-acetyltransferase [Mariluticola halotolerans]
MSLSSDAIPLDGGLSLSVTADPAEGDLAIVRGGLAAFNDAVFPPAGRKDLAVFVRGAAGEVKGGLYGYTGWGWLYVQWLWLDESLRGQGLAGKLLVAAEVEALARGCHGALIDTFSPTARRTYEHAGYQAFGELPDFPKGHTRTYLQKRLDAA